MYFLGLAIQGPFSIYNWRRSQPYDYILERFLSFTVILLNHR